MKFHKIFSAMALSLLLAVPVQAAESGWQEDDYIQARLLDGGTATGAGNDDSGYDVYQAGLAIRLDKGWHAYWRTPGDGGLAPRLDWHNSENVAHVAVSWPLPQRIETLGLYSFGYKDDVTLPLAVHIPDPAQPATLDLRADIMICKNICVPQSVALSMAIPARRKRATGADLAAIEKAMAKVPHDGNVPGLKIEHAVIGPEAAVITAFSQAGFAQADLFIEAGDLVITAMPDITIDQNDPRKAMIRVAAPADSENFPVTLMKGDLTLTLSNGQTAIEKTISFNDSNKDQ